MVLKYKTLRKYKLGNSFGTPLRCADKLHVILRILEM